MENPFLHSPVDVANILETDFESGLSTIEVQKRLIEYGRNELSGGESIPTWKILVKQIVNSMTMVCIYTSSN